MRRRTRTLLHVAVDEQVLVRLDVRRVDDTIKVVRRVDPHLALCGRRLLSGTDEQSACVRAHGQRSASDGEEERRDIRGTLRSRTRAYLRCSTLGELSGARRARRAARAGGSARPARRPRPAARISREHARDAAHLLPVQQEAVHEHPRDAPPAVELFEPAAPGRNGGVAKRDLALDVHVVVALVLGRDGARTSYGVQECRETRPVDRTWRVVPVLHAVRGVYGQRVLWLGGLSIYPRCRQRGCLQAQSPNEQCQHLDIASGRCTHVLVYDEAVGQNLAQLLRQRRLAATRRAAASANPSVLVLICKVETSSSPYADEDDQRLVVQHASQGAKVADGDRSAADY